MPNEEERLVVALEARINQFEKNMQKAERTGTQAFRKLQGASTKATMQMERDMVRSSSRINQALATASSKVGDFGKAFATGFISAAALRSAQQLIDASTRIENALKVAGLAGEDLTNVYDALFASAQQNAAPLESLVTLYGRLSLVQKELNVSQEELLGFSNNIALALRVSGQSAEQSSGALLQLSQALGGGVVRAEEFNSVLEGAPTIAQAVAAGLEEAGGSVSKLRNLVVDGKVSSEAFFRAFEAGAATLREKVAGSSLTVSQQFVRLQNVMIDTAGKIDKATDASGRLGGGLEDLAATVQSFGATIVSVAESDVGAFIGKIADAYGQVSGLIKLMGGLPGVFAKVSQMNVDIMNGKKLGDTMSDEAIQNRINDAFKGDPAMPKTGRLPAAVTETPAVKPVSLEDYPVSGSKAGKTGGGGAKRSAGAAAADRERESVQKLIKEMEEELSLVGKSDEAKRAAEATRRAGASATDAERQKIVELNEALFQQEEAAQAAADQMDFYKDVARDVLDDIQSAMDDGKITWKEWGSIALNVLNKVISRVGDDLIDSIFSANKAASSLGAGGGGGSFLGSIFGGIGKLFGLPGNAEGTDHWKGGPTWVGEKGPEIVDLPRGAQVTPNHAIGMGMGGGQITVKTINEVRNGNLIPLITEVSGTVAGQKVQQAAPAILQQANRQILPTVAAHQRDKTGGDYRT